MLKLITITLFTLLLTSCSTASHVTKPRKPSHAPKDYKPIGVVKYLNQGADVVIEARREDAFKKMSEACKGEYKVLGEAEKPDNSKSTTYNSFTNSLDSFSSNYWYIRYQCE